MKYSNSVKAILLATINEFPLNPEDYAVHPSKDFSRNRKLGFKDFLLMFLTMEGDCIKEELYRYFSRITDAPDSTYPATIYICDRGYASFNNYA